MERDGYVNDTPYLPNYLESLAPTQLRLACALNNVTPPVFDEGLAYCDLGCGMGQTLSTLAAAMPGSQFWGVDSNREHVDSARASAQAWRLDNLHFLERDFGSIGAGELPDFDIIVLHGIYTWVGDEVRSAIVRLVERHLKPGGLFYVGYNALPGWSAITPVRDAMRFMTSRMEGPTLDKVGRALEYLRFMHAQGAELITHSDVTKAMVEKLLQLDRRYVAHEYFTDDWRPMYFQEVVEDLADIDLHFVGSLPLYKNDDTAAIPDRFHAAFGTIRSRLVREVHKDFVTFETFRKDVFVRGEPSPLADTEAERLGDLPFGSYWSRSELGVEASLPSRRLDYSADIFGPLCDALGRRAGTARELRDEHRELARYALGDIVSALKALAFGQQVQPFLRSTSPATAPRAERYRLRSGFNRAQLEGALASRQAALFASECLGCGCGTPFNESLFISGLEAVGASGLLDWASHALEEPTGRLEAEIEAFVEHKLPKLVELQILEPWV